MKLKENYELKKIGDKTLIVTTDTTKPLNDNIVLSDSAVFLWNEIKNNPDITKEQLLNALLNRFDISTVLALNNIDVFIKALKQNDIIED